MEVDDVPNVNSCNFVGRLGADPKVNEVSGGNKVAQVSVAVSERWKDKSGDWQEETSWWQLKGWGYDADKIAKWKKGDEVLLSNVKATVEEWEDNDGNKRVTPTLTMQRGSAIWKLWSHKQEQAAASVPDDGGDDDLPF